MSREIKITLKAARINAGLTREEVAKRIGVTPASVQNAERGEVDPRYSFIKKLSDLYEIPIDALVVPEKLTKS